MLIVCSCGQQFERADGYAEAPIINKNTRNSAFPAIFEELVEGALGNAGWPIREQLSLPASSGFNDIGGAA